MTQKVLAISGKKKSGKNTVANFIVGCEMVSIGLIDEFRISDNGELIVPAQTEDGIEEGVFDLNRKDPAFLDWLDENLSPNVQTVSFADPLKEFCVDVMGLSIEQCYGTDEQKNSATKFLWSDFPQFSSADVKKLIEQGDCLESTYSGNMTARQFMQYFGTNICRKIKNDVWAEALVKRIPYLPAKLVIITDCRFPNEVEAVKSIGGRVIRLMRDVCEGDQHESETLLDRDKYDWSNFDGIINNQNTTIPELNNLVYQLLSEWGWVEKIENQ